MPLQVMLFSPGKDCQLLVMPKKVMQEYDNIMPERTDVEPKIVICFTFVAGLE